jgi:hypothetical protein
MHSAPIFCARSKHVEMPPAVETCAPIFIETSSVMERGQYIALVRRRSETG